MTRLKAKFWQRILPLYIAFIGTATLVTALKWG